MTLKVLVAAFVLVMLAVGATSWQESRRRTAEAGVEIVALDSTASPHPLVGGGIDIRYRFTANGMRYEFTAYRSWSLETIHAAKVCYDPNDPANQRLVEEADRCG